VASGRELERRLKARGLGVAPVGLGHLEPGTRLLAAAAARLAELQLAF
jgi:hypothetical protein